VAIFNLFSFLLPHWAKDRHPGSRSLAYRSDIDGLRAIAILSVVAYHAGFREISGGFVGVDVFFVISGYLIITLLFREIQAKGTINLVEFYARRVRRLLPALVTVVAVTLVLGVVFMFPLELPRLGKSAMALLLAGSNFHFMQYSGGYFDPSTDVMPLLHTWSLSVEEQYYLTWPLLLMLLGWGAKQSRRLSLETLSWAALGTVLVASYAACYWFTQHNQAAAFYLMPLRAWEFALGGLIGLAQNRFSLTPRIGTTLAFLGLAAIGLTVVLIDDNTRFPGLAVLAPTLGTAATIYGLSFSSRQSPAFRILSSKPLVEIGLLSYSWYLWHWSLLALTRTYFLGERDIVRDTVAVLVAFFLAWLTYWLIENPIRYRKPWAFKKAWGTLAIGATLSFFCLLLAHEVIEWGRNANGQLNEIIWSHGEKNPFGYNKCKEVTGGKSLAPLEECLLGKKGSPVLLLMWGDSHTYQYAYAPSLPHLMAQANEQILVRSHGACPPLLGAIPYKKDEGEFACGHFNENVSQEIRTLAASGIKGVILSARWNAYLSMQTTEPGAIASYGLVGNWHALEAQGPTSSLRVGVSPLDIPGSMSTMTQALRATLEELSQLGLRVLIIAPGPELNFNGPQCLYRKSEKECVIPRSHVEQRRSRTLQILKSVSAEFHNVHVVDPIDQFCDQELCYTKRNGIDMYGDDNHISAEMAQQLLAWMQPQLDWLRETRAPAQ